MTDREFQPSHFDIANLEDEIRVDQLCGSLLQRFCQHLTAAGTAADEAGGLARGADYFLRDFVIADRRENIFDLSAQRIRQFGGNWYIIRNLEPNMAELTAILAGVAAFYRFCQAEGRIPRSRLDSILTACNDSAFYAARIDSFWAIRGDGYYAWDALCPLTAS